MKQKLTGVFVLLMGLILLPTMGSELLQTLAAKAPTPLQWSAFAADKPEAGWYRIAGAQLDVTGALWVEENGEVGNVYVPARKAGGEMGNESPVEMLVKISDAEIIATVKQLKALDSAGENAATQYVLAHQKKLLIRKPLVGTLADGVDAVDSDDEKAIRRSDVKLSDDFVILQEGAKPSLGGHLFMFGFGLVMALGGVFLLIGKKVM